MPVRYYLRPNPLPSKEPHLTSQVVSVDSLDEEALIDRIAVANPTITRPQVAAVLATLNETVAGLIADGIRVNVAGLAHLFPVMTGKFKTPEDEYDPKRHEVGVAAAVNVGLVEKVKTRAIVEKQKPVEVVPTLTFYEESGARVEPGKLIAGNIGTLHGRRLAFDSKVTDEGVFFIAAEGPKREVRVKVYAVVHPTEIMFQVPGDLPAGRWVVEVRARVRGGKQLRSGRLSSPLEAGT